MGLTSRGFPSLFQADSDDEVYEVSSDSGDEREQQNALPSQLPLNVCYSACNVSLHLRTKCNILNFVLLYVGGDYAYSKDTCNVA